jgi:hypothetical protein
MGLSLNDLTGLGSVFDFGAKVMDKIFPDPQKAQEAKIELFKLQQSGELAQLAADTDLAKAQIGVNTVEAGNASTFVSGWRPFVGWVGGVGLAYAAILEPVARFVAAVGFHYTGTFPVLDTTITMQLLFGLLGLGTMRSYDKKQGTS